MHHLFARLLSAGVSRRSGALNGHTFAAGAMLSLCLDLRLMRSDRGWWCLPEADIDIPFVEPMNALIVAKVAQPLVHELMVFAPRLGGEEAAARGLVHEAVTADAGRRRRQLHRLAALCGPDVEQAVLRLQRDWAAVGAGSGQAGNPVPAGTRRRPRTA